MSVLAKKPHTVGNRKRWTITYARWLPEGVTIASETVTSSSNTATVDGVTSKDHHLTFFTNGGVLNETFTVSVQIVDTIGQIKNDTVEFTVVSP